MIHTDGTRTIANSPPRGPVLDLPSLGTVGDVLDLKVYTKADAWREYHRAIHNADSALADSIEAHAWERLRQRLSHT